MGYVDLHVHTTHSDGALSPAQMVEKAKAAGVTTLAIADHDKISGSQKKDENSGTEPPGVSAKSTA